MSIAGQDCPNLEKVVEAIGAKSPFQKKSTNKYIDDCDATFVQFAEDWVSRLLEARGEDGGYDKLAQDYIWYTKLIRIEEMHFAKHKDYRYDDYQEVYERVYGRDDYMLDYVTGLGMTQMFWANHYGIVRFYLDKFIPLIKEAKTGAEVGVGHGLFHSEMLRGAPNLTSSMLDVSNTSLSFTSKVVAATGLDPNRATPKKGDVQREIPLEDGSLDVLLFGEVIEHLEKGKEVFANLCKKMSSDGLCFFTTACNAPAEDHILLFRTLKEVHDVIENAGWTILDEYTATLGDMSIEQAEKDGQNINYAAILKVA